MKADHSAAHMAGQPRLRVEHGNMVAAATNKKTLQSHSESAFMKLTKQHSL